jgi:hypothetical protein
LLKEKYILYKRDNNRRNKMTQTFGEVSYDEVPGDKKEGNSKDLFLRLDEGDNELRLLTSPFQYMVHKVKKDPNNLKDFGQKVQCSAFHGSCPACARDPKDLPKRRWLYGVISRKTNTYKILDVSWQVFSDIKKLAKNVQRWGDPTKYDINVVVDPSAGAAGYYSVQPLPKEPLSAADQQIKDGIDFEDLRRRVTPPTPDFVQKRLDKILGAGAPVVSAPVVKKNASKTQAVSMTDDEESTESFPDYDTSA